MVQNRQRLAGLTISPHPAPHLTINTTGAMASSEPLTYLSVSSKLGPMWIGGEQ
jgi:hypothetical protein